MEEFESIYIKMFFFLKKHLVELGGFQLDFVFFLPSDDALRWILALLDLKMVCWDLRLERWSQDFSRIAMSVRHVWTYLPYFFGCLQMAINPQFPSQKCWHFCWMFDNFLPKNSQIWPLLPFVSFYSLLRSHHLVGFQMPRLYAHPGCHGPIMTWLRWISFPYGWEWTKRCWDEVIFEDLRNRIWQTDHILEILLR